MKKLFGKLQLDRSLIRPIAYQVFTRFLIGLCIALLAVFLIFGSTEVPQRGAALLIAAALSIAMAWAAWLRLDGVKLMRFDRKLFRRKKSPERAFGDMIDHVDEPVTTFEELSDEEKDLALLISNLITTALFALGTLVF